MDPKEAVLSFDALWNSHDRDSILDRIDESAVVEVTPPPPPPARGRYTGKDEVAEFVSQFLPGFHVDSRNFRIDGGEIGWEFSASNDAFRALGANTFSGTCHMAAGDDGRMRRFRVELDAATVERLSAAAAGR